MSSDSLRQRGFTLLEIVCTLIILGVLGAMTFSGFGSALTGYALMRESGTTTMQAELALIRLQQELSAATYDITVNNGTLSFLRADATTASTIALSDTKLLLNSNPLLENVATRENTAFVSINETTGLITLSFQLKTESGTTPFTLSVSPRNSQPATN